MREHPLVASPLHAFAHKHGDPDIDLALRPFGEGSWPSELPTGGRAGWGEFIEKDGEVTVSYPAVRYVDNGTDLTIDGSSFGTTMDGHRCSTLCS